jgi:hypothetical protein
LVWKLQNKPSVTTIFIFIFWLQSNGKYRVWKICVWDAGKILWQLVHVIFTGRPPELAIPRCYCLSAKTCVHKISFINTLISKSKETSCLPNGKLIVDLPMREVVSIGLPT